MVETLKLLPEQMAKASFVNFPEEMRKITNAINSASVTKKRSDPNCHSCFNDVLVDLEMSEAEKIRIANIRDKNFSSKPEEEQKKISDKILHYKGIKPIFKVRFRSYQEGLKRLLEAKPVVQKCALPSSPNFELFPDGDLSWDLVTALFNSFSKVTYEIDCAEKSTAGLSGYISSFLDLIESTLDKKSPESQM